MILVKLLYGRFERVYASIFNESYKGDEWVLFGAGPGRQGATLERLQNKEHTCAIGWWVSETNWAQKQNTANVTGTAFTAKHHLT